MMKMKKSAGELLRTIRKNKDISLKEVAEKAGVSSMYLSEIERDKKVPSDELIYKLSEIYKVDSQLLFEKFGRVSEDMLEELISNKYLFDTIFDASKGKLSSDKKELLYKQIHELYKEFIDKENK